MEIHRLISCYRMLHPASLPLDCEQIILQSHFIKKKRQRLGFE